MSEIPPHFFGAELTVSPVGKNAEVVMVGEDPTYRIRVEARGTLAAYLVSG